MRNGYIWVAGVALVLLVSGCGDNDGNGAGVIPATDGFTSTVRGAVASAPDDTEPIGIDDVSLTSSETAEPEAL